MRVRHSIGGSSPEPRLTHARQVPQLSHGLYGSHGPANTTDVPHITGWTSCTWCSQSARPDRRGVGEWYRHVRVACYSHPTRARVRRGRCWSAEAPPFWHKKVDWDRRSDFDTTSNRVVLIISQNYAWRSTTEAFRENLSHRMVILLIVGFVAHNSLTLT
jgi:hypothetical protein